MCMYSSKKNKNKKKIEKYIKKIIILKKKLTNDWIYEKTNRIISEVLRKLLSKDTHSRFFF